MVSTHLLVEIHMYAYHVILISYVLNVVSNKLKTHNAPLRTQYIKGDIRKKSFIPLIISVQHADPNILYMNIHSL